MLLTNDPSDVPATEPLTRAGVKSRGVPKCLVPDGYLSDMSHTWKNAGGYAARVWKQRFPARSRAVGPEKHVFDKSGLSIWRLVKAALHSRKTCGVERDQRILARREPQEMRLRLTPSSAMRSLRRRLFPSAGTKGVKTGCSPLESALPGRGFQRLPILSTAWPQTCRTRMACTRSLLYWQTEKSWL